MERRDFIAFSTLSALGLFSSGAVADEKSPAPNKNVAIRGSYSNSKRVFEAEKRGTVAFLGGSITEMDGYRPMVCSDLQERFPETDFQFIAAGISSTCSDVGAFRLESDVLSQADKIDFFFVEFAVNDDQDGIFDFKRTTRGMEGIVRHMLLANPNVDIVMTFFVNEHLMDVYRKGEEATSIAAHRKIAEHYGVSTINLAKEIQEQIDDGRITWKEFGGVHPAPRGNRICADMIAGLLDSSWSQGTADALVAHPLPEPFDPFSFFNGRWRGFSGIETNVGSIDDATLPSDGGFRLYQPDWSKIPGSFRARFGGRKLLCAERAGAEARFKFTGSALSLYILAGPDAGIVECELDGGAPFRANAFHHYSAGLHYPCSLLLASELSSGEHTATIRVAPEKDANSKGTALRILEIGTND